MAAEIVCEERTKGKGAESAIRLGLDRRGQSIKSKCAVTPNARVLDGKSAILGGAPIPDIEAAVRMQEAAQTRAFEGPGPGHVGQVSRCSWCWNK